MLCGVVKECLDQTRNYSVQSIAFPTLGCGRLKYPVAQVAKCFREMTAAHGRGLQVGIFTACQLCLHFSRHKLCKVETTSTG